MWGTIAFGFAGLFDSGTALRFTPSLPSVWNRVTFRMQRHGARLRVEIDHDGCTVHVLSGSPVPIDANALDPSDPVLVEPGDSIHIATVPIA